MFKVILPFALVLGLGLWNSYAGAETGVFQLAADVVEPSPFVDQIVEDIHFKDIRNQTYSFSNLLKGKKALVIIVRDVTCPISKKMRPYIADIVKKYSNSELTFVLVNPSAHSSLKAMKSDHHEFKNIGLYVGDKNYSVISALHLKSSTQVAVLDSARRLVYTGAISDQFGIGFTKDKSQFNYLADAIEAVLSGKNIQVKNTVAPGCVLRAPAATTEVLTDLTFYRHINPIIQTKCLSCHRDGADSFSLASYNDVRSRAPMIEYVIEKDLMPPWYADRGTGPWRNDMSLTSHEKELLMEWLKNGTPEGVFENTHSQKNWLGRWQMGTPDVILQVKKPVQVHASGVMKRQQQLLKTNFGEDKYVSAVEVLPTAPHEVVHHVSVDRVEALSGTSSAVGFNDFGTFVPGQRLWELPPDAGMLLPKNSILEFDLHYTPNGKAHIDQPYIGFKFHKTKPKYLVKTLLIRDKKIIIPPGVANHELKIDYTMKFPIKILGIWFHSHARAKAAKMDVVFPDAKVQNLFASSHFNFMWPLVYFFKEPVEIPAGAVIKTVGYYDNSAANKANPDPTAEVRFGYQAFEEMNYFVIFFI